MCKTRSAVLDHQRVKLTCATILYATHLFDGLDERATHLHYITDEGKCGWKVDIEDLEKYQKMKEENEPSKMLAVAYHCLRAELERNRTLRKAEKVQGELAQESTMTVFLTPICDQIWGILFLV